MEFIFNLSTKSWDDKDISTLFNSFLNIYLRIFYASFPVMTINNNNNKEKTMKGLLSYKKSMLPQKGSLFIK
jgi:hypothetical protein